MRTIHDVFEATRDLTDLPDRPSEDRIDALVVHTVPVYFHAPSLSELVLEAAHKPLKASVTQSSSEHAHIYAVKLILARVWFLHVEQVFNVLKNGTKEWQELAMKSLFCLFGGRENANAS